MSRWLSAVFGWQSSAGIEQVPLQENFDVGRYVGLWCENYRTKNIPFESGTDIQAVYTAKEDGTVNVTNRQYFPDKKQWDTIEGTAKVVDPNEPARLSVKFRWWMPAGDYRVLYTDYDTMAVVYSEVSFLGLYRTKMSWILGRVKELPQDRIEQAFALIKERISLEKDAYLKTPVGQADA